MTTVPTQTSLIGLSRPHLEQVMAGLGESPFRARQMMQWLYMRQVTDPTQMTNFSQKFRYRLAETFSWSVPEEVKRERSVDGSEKYLFRLADGETVETVWMPQPRERYTVCVSSQVGCRMGCRFCLTATMGLKRNLSAAEIVGQVLAVKREHPVTNIVFMGMGEPLDNEDAVYEAIQVLNDDLAFKLSSRRITVSTSGLVSKIREFPKKTRAQLAISLNGTTNEARYQLMPINRRYPIEDIISAVRDAFRDDRRRVTFEYILMKGINDSPEDAERLRKMLGDVSCKVNLIPYNPNPKLPFERPSEATVLRFQQYLLEHHLNARVRWSKGLDISAACGQLVAPEVSQGGAA